jgi:hypothetical protein
MQDHLNNCSIRFALLCHVSISVPHGRAYLRMTHKFLLYANRRSAGIEQRTVAVPERMPAQMFDANLLACWNEDVPLKDTSVPDAAGVRIWKDPSLRGCRALGLLGQQ